MVAHERCIRRAITFPTKIAKAVEPIRYAPRNRSTSIADTLPSMHHSRSGRHPTECIGFSPDAFCDGFVFHGVLARGLKFQRFSSESIL